MGSVAISATSLASKTLPSIKPATIFNLDSPFEYLANIFADIIGSEEIAAAAKARNQCVKEAPMGSIRRVSRCRSEAQVKAEREAAQEAMRNRTTITGGGSAERPVGTVCLAWKVNKDLEKQETFLFEGNRNEVRYQTVVKALEEAIVLMN